jgi:sugar/nucleoside kinase (ribokinase family)
LALRLFQEANCKNLILTLGERGIMGFRNNVEQRESLNSFFVIDSFAKEVKDAVGSGDALLAYASLAGYITKDSVKAAVLGALAAAKACEFDGNIPVAVKSLRDEIDVLEQNFNFFKG